MLAILEPIANAATTAAQAPTATADTLPLDFFFPFFFPGCDCRVGFGGGPIPMSALVLIALAFVVVKLGCFRRRRQ